MTQRTVVVGAGGGRGGAEGTVGAAVVDGIVVDGIVVDGIVVDGIVVDGIVVGGIVVGGVVGGGGTSTTTVTVATGDDTTPSSTRYVNVNEPGFGDSRVTVSPSRSATMPDGSSMSTTVTGSPSTSPASSVT